MTENPMPKRQHGTLVIVSTKRAYKDGWNDAIEAVLYHLSVNMKQIKSIEALRKKVSE